MRVHRVYVQYEAFSATRACGDWGITREVSLAWNECEAFVFALGLFGSASLNPINPHTREGPFKRQADQSRIVLAGISLTRLASIGG